MVLDVWKRYSLRQAVWKAWGAVQPEADFLEAVHTGDDGFGSLGAVHTHRPPILDGTCRCLIVWKDLRQMRALPK